MSIERSHVIISKQYLIVLLSLETDFVLANSAYPSCDISSGFLKFAK